MSKPAFQGVRAVLFDLDGTLVDSAPDLGAAADKLRVERGLPSLPLEQYRPLAGAGARGMLSVAFGITPEHPDFVELRDAFFANYEACILERTDVFPGIAQMIAQIEERGLPWGIVTNKATRFTQPLIQAMPLLRGAGAVVSGDTTPHSKPHPEPLLEAARRLGVEPSSCIYVGDDERDIVAGEAAGMKTVAAVYGYLGTKTPSAWGADAMINSPDELLKLLGPD
ncbi:phosphoglycolate phosphatase [Paracidovorax wautersii]|uniref:phosphoglycolate phosphatase n=1 Tax=Paracidovorax wautersii TaxID=1177982 RepID=A0A1I1ZJE1_9BURK|nr:phosphoglycolate phosphatase [Paracidovorax wautersii]SFE31732.1 phosphoglycolate phosphatase [Paracidovorax wautersii]